MISRKIKLLGGALVAMLLFTNSLFAAEVKTGKVSEDTSAYSLGDGTDQKVCYVYEGEMLQVVEETEDYYGVLIEQDEVVYIHKESFELDEKEELAAVTEQKKDKEASKPEVAPVEKVKTSKGQEVVNYAKQFIGTPYVSGGNSLTRGVDCSGFTQQVYRHFGVSLERRSRSQYASNGKSVSKDKLQPGDLVFYGYNGNVCHVAIYVGNSQIIHSPVPGRSVCIAPLWQRGDAPIVGYKRIFND